MAKYAIGQGPGAILDFAAVMRITQIPDFEGGLLATAFPFPGSLRSSRHGLIHDGSFSVEEPKVCVAGQRVANRPKAVVRTING